MTIKTRDSEITVSMSHTREIEISDLLQINLKLPKSIGTIQSVKAVFNRKFEDPCIIMEMYKTKEERNFIEYEVMVSFAPYHRYENYFFFFSLVVNEKELYVKINRETNKAFFTTGESPYWRILVIQDNFSVPDWSKNAVFYQIFVDRFCRSSSKKLSQIAGRHYRNWGEMPDWQRNTHGDFHNNDFFGGNLKGIEEKLAYLKDLGIDVLYLSPINFSSLRYERYAATDHMQIDPDAGNFEDLENLHRKANEMGMHLILDVAFNHCNSDNPIFQDAISNPSSKYRNWFYIHDDGTYEYWYGQFRDMPLFNQFCYEYQQYVYGENGVIETYGRHVDGFRLDLASELQPFFLEGIRSKARKMGSKLILGECWNKANCETLGKGLDCITNYLFTNAVLKYVAFGETDCIKEQVFDIIESYPQNTLDTMLNALDTHDMMRALTILSLKCVRRGYFDIWEIDRDPSPWHFKTETGRTGFSTDGFREFEFANDKLSPQEYANSVKRLKTAFMLMGTLPGNLCIFYGTEKGLHGFKDPFNRKCMDWKNGDVALENFFKKYLHFWKSFKGSKIDICFLHLSSEMAAIEVKNLHNSMLTILNNTDSDIKIQIPEKYIVAQNRRIFTENATEEMLHGYGGISIILN